MKGDFITTLVIQSSLFQDRDIYADKLIVVCNSTLKLWKDFLWKGKTMINTKNVSCLLRKKNETNNRSLVYSCIN